jgi:hypothetical protein
MCPHGGGLNAVRTASAAAVSLTNPGRSSCQADTLVNKQAAAEPVDGASPLAATRKLRARPSFVAGGSADDIQMRARACPATQLQSRGTVKPRGKFD